MWWPQVTTEPTWWSTTTTSTLPVVEHTYTWREAMEIATRVREGRVTVRREGDRWAVRYYAKPVLINRSA